MNKHDWTLLVVRGFGLYLLAQALFSIPPLLGTTFLLFAAWAPLLPEGEFRGLAERLRTEFVTQIISNGARLLLYGCAGLYLLRSTSILRGLGIPEAVSD